METTVGRRLVAQLVGIALVSLPTVAHAHGGNNDPNVVHACIGNISKIVRIVGVSGACIASPPLVAETPAHWDVQGPAGPPGATGTNGANGKDGINGKDGTNGIDGTSVTFVDYFSGSQHGCPNGGAIFAAGSVNAYVCNGVDGKDGKDGKDGAGATRADGPCFDDGNRYVDCRNGTVTDTLTGLIWLKQADCLSIATWAAANQAAAGLKHGDCAGGLTDGSSPGDWRLPTKAEWELIIELALQEGCQHPSLTNDAGTECYGESAWPSSFVGIASDNYWSSTSKLPYDRSWDADVASGAVIVDVKYYAMGVWPVRSGPR